MYPLKKLGQLPPKTRFKKIILILSKMEHDLRLSDVIPAGLEEYFEELSRILANDPVAADFIASIGAGSAGLTQGNPKPGLPLIRLINNLRHALARHLGISSADWDFIEPGTGLLDAGRRMVLPFRLFLEDIRSPYNVGSIMRSAEAFGVERVFLSPRCPLPDHPRASRTGRGTEKILPWEIVTIEEAAIKSAAYPIFALETGGVSMEEFEFPDRGLVLIGSEELGLSEEAIAIADKSLGLVSIPMAGAKRSLNVAVSAGILLQEWFFRKKTPVN